MKNKAILRAGAISAALLTVLALPCFGVAAANEKKPDFSPALRLLADEIRLEKSGLLKGGISFTANDFCETAGVDTLSGVTLLTLPDESVGTLYVGEEKARERQVLSPLDMEKLRFLPSTVSPADASFTYGVVGEGGQYETVCRLHLLSALNLSPTADEGESVTYEGIACYGSLSGSDPEGDTLRYETVSEPRRGVVLLEKDGSFCYYPTEAGEDSFRYVCIDSCGNRSEAGTRKVSVKEMPHGLRCDDLKDDPCGVAAMTLCEKGLMSGQTVGDCCLFRPDTAISREDFATVLLSAMELPPDTDLSALTVFADGECADSLCAPYLAKAAGSGWLIGEYDDEGRRMLRPTDAITKEEAYRLLAAATNKPVGSVDPDPSPLTRGEAAMCICEALSLLP